jgi:FkbM family methyltransferase
MADDWRLNLIKRTFHPFEPLFKYLGIRSYARHGYDAIERWIQPDSLEVNVAGAKARFCTRTQGEYRRVTTMLEQDIIADVLKHVESTDVFWDIGASTGPFTCLVADKIETGTILAVEPHPGNMASLRRNVDLNDFENVITKQIALGKVNGTTRFAMNSKEAGTGLHSISFGPNEMNDKIDRRSIEVIVKRGDELLSNAVPTPTVVKIDVEGAEPLVIQGMENVLSDPRCRVLYCEVHAGESHPNSIRRFDITPEEFSGSVEALGFEVTKLDTGSTFTLRGKKR